jgi:hypothetical protein
MTTHMILNPAESATSGLSMDEFHGMRRTHVLRQLGFALLFGLLVIDVAVALETLARL